MQNSRYLKYAVIVLAGVVVLELFFIVTNILSIKNKYPASVKKNILPLPKITLTPLTPTPTVIHPSNLPPIIPTRKPTIEPTQSSSETTQTKNVQITYYAWGDNDPPNSSQIAYPHNRYPASLHDQAGGIGTYDDPITFATDPNEFAIGTKLYIPYIKKYVIMEDWCAGCVDNWNNEEYHIDIWLNSNDSFTNELNACAHALTRRNTVIEVDPPAGKPVNTSLLFDMKYGSCYTP